MRLLAALAGVVLLASCSSRSAPSYVPGVFGAPMALAQHACAWSSTQLPLLNAVGNSLLSVRAFSATDVYAAGLTSTPAIAHWNGASWVRENIDVAGVSQAFVGTIGGVSPDSLWAAGNAPQGSQGNRYPIAFHFNGTSWRNVPLPAIPQGYTGTVFALKAVATGDVWALVDIVNFTTAAEQFLIAFWNGSHWQYVAYPHPASEGRPEGQIRLESIDARSRDDVWVAGYITGTIQPLIEHHDTQGWHIFAAPAPRDPRADGGVQLYGVYAESAGDVWVVGTYTILYGAVERAYTAHWNGMRWASVAAPNFDGGSALKDNVLMAVGGSSANNVWAVGQAGFTWPLAIQWDGSAWRLPEAPASFAPAAFTALAVLGPLDVWAVGTTDSSQDPSSVADHYCL